MLGNKEIKPMPKKVTKLSVDKLQKEVSNLAKQADELYRQVYQLQLEKDILEKSAEIIKKEQGIKLQTLTNKEKAIVIDVLREKYQLKELLSVLHMAKSLTRAMSKKGCSPDNEAYEGFFGRLKNEMFYGRLG